MPPDAGNPGDPHEWLRHARSDLALAQVDRPEGVLLEGLCYHAQQAAEKALKAVLILNGIPSPYTHSIRALLDSLPPGMVVPGEVEDAAILTTYAISTRYPGDLEPVEKQEHQKAIRLATAVVSWASSTIRA